MQWSNGMKSKQRKGNKKYKRIKTVIKCQIKIDRGDESRFITSMHLLKMCCKWPKHANIFLQCKQKQQNTNKTEKHCGNSGHAFEIIDTDSAYLTRGGVCSTTFELKQTVTGLH